MSIRGRRNYASVKRRERLEHQAIPMELWMRHGGMTHAQPHVISSPIIIVGALAVGVILIVFIGATLVYQLRSIAHSLF
jgi:hypothetical protein